MKYTISMLFCLCSIFYLHASEVYIHNFTPYTFSLEVLQQDGTLSAQQRDTCTPTISAFSKDKIYEMRNGTTEKNDANDCFVFVLKTIGTHTFGDGDTITLTQDLKSKIVEFKTPQGTVFIQAAFKSDDKKSKYVLSMPDAPSFARYDQGFYLTAHNAFATSKEGYIYAQQNLSLSKQLSSGARGLMLDTYEKDGKVVLVHGGFDTDKLIHPGKGPQLLENLVKKIEQFLITNPQAIITIFLENYVKNRNLLIDAFKLLDAYIFKVSDYQTLRGWPTCEWMRTYNKRVVIFCPDIEFVYLFNEWQHHIENQYSTIDKKEAATERSSSKKVNKWRSLYVYNFFPEFKITSLWGMAFQFKSINGGQLKEALNYAITNGLEGKYKGQKPNFIALDYINVGKGLEIISQWNGALLTC